MTEKKTKGKKAKLPDGLKHADVVPLDHDPNQRFELDEGSGELVAVVSAPDKGPDYHITDAGEILLDSGGPIPEDHHVHPAHRLLALARKDARGKS